MDQRTGRIAEDLKDIVQTRAAIAEKLGLIEQRITHSIEDAKQTVTGMVKQTTQAVQGAVDSAKRTLDPAHQASVHPWLVVGGAIVVGFAIGEAIRAAQSSGVYPYSPPRAGGVPVMPSPGSSNSSEEGIYPYYPESSTSDFPSAVPSGAGRAGASRWFDFGDSMSEELAQIKTELAQAARTLLHAWIQEAVPVVARKMGLRTIPNTPRQTGT